MGAETETEFEFESETETGFECESESELESETVTEIELESETVSVVPVSSDLCSELCSGWSYLSYLSYWRLGLQTIPVQSEADCSSPRCDQHLWTTGAAR